MSVTARTTRNHENAPLKNNENPASKKFHAEQTDKSPVHPLTVIPKRGEGSSPPDPAQEPCIPSAPVRDDGQNIKRKRGQSVQRPAKQKAKHGWGWTPQRRAAASARAKAQKPWQHATGPKTAEGKSRIKFNAYKNGQHTAARLALRRALADHSRWLARCLKIHKAPRIILVPGSDASPKRKRKPRPVSNVHALKRKQSPAQFRQTPAQKNISFGSCSLYPRHVYGFTESIKVRVFSLFLTILLFSFAITINANAQAGLSVNSLRIGTYPDKTRMVIDVSRNTDFRAFMLENPSRLVIDLPTFEWRAVHTLPPKGSLVSAIRNGTLEPGISRIVVDLEKQVTLKSAFILPAGPGISDRVVIDFAPVSAGYSFSQERMFGNLVSKGGQLNIPQTANAPAAPKAQPPKNNRDTETAYTLKLPESRPAVREDEEQGEAPAPAPARSGKGPKPLIVIDPGHGGQDPGAIGANGTQEKTVTLATAQELKRQLEDSGRYRVHLTRSTDKFIKLQDRVAIGREKGADLFISLHADSIDKPGVSGASIYTLSNKASDAQTAKLAARENRADLIAGVDLSHEDKQVANILIDLAMRDTMNQSKFFANNVVKNAQRQGIQMLDKPHRFAGFAVLKAPDVPSVLIEMGFMSNKREVNQLSSPAYRQKIAGSIMSGIDAYFAKVQKNGQN